MFATTAFVFIFSCLGAAVPTGIPQKPDPPIAIDGDLGDWAAVPNAIKYDEAGQVVWGKSAWKSTADLSGTAKIAWRAEHLYISAAVTDDVLAQTQRGEGIWKGDHVELYVDAFPELEPSREPFGEGQYHFAFSPGNFGASGDALADCHPEAFCYTPAGGSVEGIKVAAKRIESGWTIEAAIPWSLMKVKSPASGIPLRIELCLSDSDTANAQQESLMAISQAPWGHTRSRLVPAVLAGADGVPPASTPAIDVFKEAKIPPAGKQTFEFTAPPTPEGKIAALSMLARLQYDQVAGFATALRVTLNGTAITGDRLLNKPLRVKARGGDIYSMAAGELFSTYYSPDFTSPNTHPHYGLVSDVKPCEFEFNVSGLLKEGRNTLLIEHSAPAVKCDLILANGKLAFRLPPPPPKQLAGPPTGPLVVFEPRAEHKTAYTAIEKDGAIEIAVAGEIFSVESKFSTPKPEWVKGTCSYFALDRRIEQTPEAIKVFDTFKNLTNENLPIMRRNQVHLGERLKRLWLAGLEQMGKTASQSNPSNPTTFAAMEKCGLGFIPLDDVARIHVVNYAVDDGIGLGDNNLVLRPNSTYTAEWAIIPRDTPDYWTFLNAARRLIDANFIIDGGFAFLRADALTDPWTDDQLTSFIQYKDAKYVCSSIGYYKQGYAHGTAFQSVSYDNFIKSFARWRKLVPQAKYLVYFHCFIDVIEDGPQKFPDSRLLQPDGTQADYGEPYDRIYFPTESNSYGREIGKNVDLIFDKIGADGVYWDEHEYSRYHYHYGEPWDGFTADIDPATMKISRLKSSVTLLTEPWRLALAKKILARGPLIGNGPPFTRAMAALKFPCFVETGSITNCAQAHLHSPIALGDHLTERSETDAYRVMLAALDFGCVYHWYNDLSVIPTHPHLTRYMYPITPVELHQGYLIGKERIITKVSGLFGWGDTRGHEVHAFDDGGKEVEGYKAPPVTRDGKTYTELRLGENWSAVIVAK